MTAPSVSSINRILRNATKAHLKRGRDKMGAELADNADEEDDVDSNSNINDDVDNDICNNNVRSEVDGLNHNNNNNAWSDGTKRAISEQERGTSKQSRDPTNDDTFHVSHCKYGDGMDPKRDSNPLILRAEPDSKRNITASTFIASSALTAASATASASEPASTAGSASAARSTSTSCHPFQCESLHFPSIVGAGFPSCISDCRGEADNRANFQSRQYADLEPDEGRWTRENEEMRQRFGSERAVCPNRQSGVFGVKHLGEKYDGRIYTNQHIRTEVRVNEETEACADGQTEPLNLKRQNTSPLDMGMKKKAGFTIIDILGGR